MFPKEKDAWKMGNIPLFLLIFWQLRNKMKCENERISLYLILKGCLFC